MPSVSNTTASRSPRAAHRSSEDQYGWIIAHARGSVRRKLVRDGAPGGLSTRCRRKLSLRDASGRDLNRLVILIHREVTRLILWNPWAVTTNRRGHRS